MTVSEALERAQDDRADLANRLCRMGLLRYRPDVPDEVGAEMERILNSPDRHGIELTATEWGELVHAAAAAENAVDPESSIYDSIKHWVAAILPLHERMIRERIGGEVTRLRAENADYEASLGVPA
ncbi:hypothetical protein BG418_18155 [Streptomyces sp. CBMA152]|nr:hypothetical protein [Streptomyces sp. CBMA152]